MDTLPPSLISPLDHRSNVNDFLRAVGLTPDSKYRKKLAVEFGIVSKENDYNSTTIQNDALLIELRNMFRLSRGLVGSRLLELEAQALPL